MNKILILRFSSIGDIVLTTPVLRCLKKHMPDVKLHYVTKEQFSPLLKYNPYLDKVITLDNDINKLIKELKAENYDYVIDLHNNLRTLKIKMALGKPSQSIKKRNIEKWLFVNLNLNIIPKEHIVDRYMKTVEHFGVKYDGMGLDCFLTTAEKVETSGLPAPWDNGYIGLVIGAKHNTKKLPVSKIIELVNQMKLPVVLLGGKEDEPAGEMIAASSSGYAYNACGRYELLQSASLVKNAKAIITHDTGLMHIAAAFQKRIISVWGNTVPGFGMYPFMAENKGESIFFENNKLTCRPCSKIGYEECPKKHFNCMTEIDTPAIARQIQLWWGK